MTEPIDPADPITAATRGDPVKAATHAEPVDPVAAATHADPYPCYASLRNGPPLAWHDGLRMWVASRADVVAQLLSAPAALRVRPVAEPVPRAILGSPAGEVFGHLVRMNDGAPHAAHRPALQRALAGLDLDAVHAAALRVARGVEERPLNDALFSMPVRAVAQLLGFDDASLPRVDAWMRDFVACLSPLSSPVQLGAAGVAAQELMARFDALARQAAPPPGSLLRAVLAESNAGITRALLANLVGLLSQTCDATAGLLGNSLLAIVRDPSLPARGSLVQIVAETARHDASVQNTRRFVAEPIDIAGTPLAPGDAVLLLLAAANRDPAFNPEPDAFRLVRATRRTMGFGHGPHACPGQALACTLAAAGLAELLRRDAPGQVSSQVPAQMPAQMPAQPSAKAPGQVPGWRYRPSPNARIPLFD